LASTRATTGSWSFSWSCGHEDRPERARPSVSGRTRERRLRGSLWRVRVPAAAADNRDSRLRQCSGMRPEAVLRGTPPDCVRPRPQCARSRDVDGDPHALETTATARPRAPVFRNDARAANGDGGSMPAVELFSRSLCQREDDPACTRRPRCRVWVRLRSPRPSTATEEALPFLL
jgi:hypothetical protein